MRLCGRACAFVGMLILVLGVGACSGAAPEPNQYELGDAAEPGSPDDFTAEAGDVVYFEGDSVALSSEAQATLRKQVRWLNQHPEYQVTIAGHADEWGTRQHNLSLGAKRAIAVKRFLEDNGLRVSRLHTVSYGKERPVADCTALSCRAKNRRARTVISTRMAAR